MAMIQEDSTAACPTLFVTVTIALLRGNLKPRLGSMFVSEIVKRELHVVTKFPSPLSFSFPPPFLFYFSLSPSPLPLPTLLFSPSLYFSFIFLKKKTSVHNH